MGKENVGLSDRGLRRGVRVVAPALFVWIAACSQERKAQRSTTAGLPVAMSHSGLSVLQSETNFSHSSGSLNDVAVDVAGDIAIIGMHLGFTDLVTGSAFVYKRVDGTWQTGDTDAQSLWGSDLEFLDRFGSSVAIDGDTIAVGASFSEGQSTPACSSEIGETGAAYVFVGSDGVWPESDPGNGELVVLEQAILTASCSRDSDDQDKDGDTSEILDFRDRSAQLGASIDIADDVIVAGAPFSNTNDAYDKIRDSDGNVLFQGTGPASDPECDNSPCEHAAISGCCFAQTECDCFTGIDANNCADATGQVCGYAHRYPDKRLVGSVFVFARNLSGASAGQWNSQSVTRLLSDDGEAGDNLGSSVSISGDSDSGYTVASGAPDRADLGVEAGAVYVFSLQLSAGGSTTGGGPGGGGRGGGSGGGGPGGSTTSASWTQTQKIFGSQTTTGDLFGSSVALSGDIMIVGAPKADNDGTDRGAAYVFERVGGVWTETQRLQGSVQRDGAEFGRSVAFDGDSIAVGEGGGGPPAVYSFKRVDGTWAEALRILPDNSSQAIGNSIAIDGTTLLTGVDDGGPGQAFAYEIYEYGNSCDSAADCDSGANCVDGVCCDSACGDGASDDCLVCSVAAGGATDGACGAIVDSNAAAQVVCRAASGLCDAAERCAVNVTECPEDQVLSPGAVCRAAAGDCDLAEQCDGQSKTCPDDAVVAVGTECRAVAGDCDVAESCDGASAACPTDAFVASGSTCRVSAGDCDAAETCTGTAAECPADDKLASGTVCRGAAGVCDQAETCDGQSDSCPDDEKLASTVVCRASVGSCDVVETCDGASDDCPADAVVPANVVCRDAVGECDVAEACDGESGQCPTDELTAAETVCRASAGDCDLAESCDGVSDSCPDDGKLAVGTVCRAAAGDCDVAESCDGVSDSCPDDGKLAVGTVCRAAAGDCDVAESCDGSSDTCPDDVLVAAQTECRASAGACDAAEVCDGQSGQCPTDQLRVSGTVCRESTNSCDPAESCDGATASCPDETTVTGCGELDSSGGQVSSADGRTRLNFPVGSLGAALAVTVSEVDPDAVSEPTGAGAGFVKESVVDLQAGEQEIFDPPVELQMDVTAEQVAKEVAALWSGLFSGQSSLIKLSLELYIAHYTNAGQWEAVSGSAQRFVLNLDVTGLSAPQIEGLLAAELEKQAETISLSASLGHFSTYAVHFRASVEPVAVPTSGGSSGSSSGGGGNNGNSGSSGGCSAVAVAPGLPAWLVLLLAVALFWRCRRPRRRAPARLCAPRLDSSRDRHR